MPNPVVHFEIGCKDLNATKEFYESIFDWKISQKELSADIDTEEGISGHIAALGHEHQEYINIYIEVEDIEAYLDTIEQSGGKRMIGPNRLPDGRDFAWFKDVANNKVGLITPNKG